MRSTQLQHTPAPRSYVDPFDPKGGVEPSRGIVRRIDVPWGGKDKCIIYQVRGFNGYEYYAQSYRPKSNPGVTMSTFLMRSEQ